MISFGSGRDLTGVAAGSRDKDGRRGRRSYLEYGAAVRGGLIESPAAERYPLGRHTGSGA